MDIVIVSCGIVLVTYVTGMMILCIRSILKDDYEGEEYLEPDQVK